MDNNDSNIKSQQTGGLKLMTVFIAVLALHVVVIGGFTVYHLMSGGNTDADLTTLDKNHKGLKNADGTAITDGTTSDASQGEKNAPSTTTPTPPTEVATIPQAASGPANSPAPASNLTAPSEMVTPAPGPSPVLTPAPTLATPAFTLTPKPVTPLAPIAPELVPPTEPAFAPLTPAPSATVASGPVHMPPVASTSAAPKSGREHEQTYTVKITDSYKKIAQAHHITVAQLKEANHIKGDTLHTGQKLAIPSAKTLVASTATTATTAALTSTSTGPILSEPAPASTAVLASAPSTETATASHRPLYTVVKGDTLIKIAHKFKTTPTAIMTANSITDPARLTIGKKLKIPSQESRSAKVSAPASTQPSQVQTQENTPSGELANFVP